MARANKCAALAAPAAHPLLHGRAQSDAWSIYLAPELLEASVEERARWGAPGRRLPRGSTGRGPAAAGPPPAPLGTAGKCQRGRAARRLRSARPGPGVRHRPPELSLIHISE